MLSHEPDRCIHWSIVLEKQSSWLNSIVSNFDCDRTTNCSSTKNTWDKKNNATTIGRGRLPIHASHRHTTPAFEHLIACIACFSLHNPRISDLHYTATLLRHAELWCKYLHAAAIFVLWNVLEFCETSALLVRQERCSWMNAPSGIIIIMIALLPRTAKSVIPRTIACFLQHLFLGQWSSPG